MGGSTTPESCSRMKACKRFCSEGGRGGPKHSAESEAPHREREGRGIPHTSHCPCAAARGEAALEASQRE